MAKMSDFFQKNKLNDALNRLTLTGSAMDPIGRELDHLHRLATMGTLAAGVAHEINNILTPAHAYAQIALSNPGNQGLVEKALEKAVSSIEAATSIADNILGFTSDSGSAGESCSIRQVAELTIESARQRSGAQHVEFEIRIPHDLMAQISSIALQHVLLNLFLNAFAAMPDGGRLTIHASEESGDHIGIVVSDSGTGIGPEMIDMIFKPFESSGGQRGKRDSTCREKAGHGLGLAVCRHLVEMANGSIRAENNEDGGAEFSILLKNGRNKHLKAV
jgi:signal transduction histidine kinase